MGHNIFAKHSVKDTEHFFETAHRETKYFNPRFLHETLLWHVHIFQDELASIRLVLFRGSLYCLSQRIYLHSDCKDMQKVVGLTPWAHDVGPYVARSRGRINRIVSTRGCRTERNRWKTIWVTYAAAVRRCSHKNDRLRRKCFSANIGSIDRRVRILPWALCRDDPFDRALPFVQVLKIQARARIVSRMHLAIVSREDSSPFATLPKGLSPRA